MTEQKNFGNLAKVLIMCDNQLHKNHCQRIIEKFYIKNILGEKIHLANLVFALTHQP